MQTISSDNLLQVKVVDDITDINDPTPNWKNSGLELLIEYTKTGEMDPWDIDLVYLINKFLYKIKDGSELSHAADIIYFLSILLRIKSENIYTPNATDESEYDDEWIDFDGMNSDNSETTQQQLLASLDNALIRNPKFIKKQRKRNVTLKDLITIFNNTPVVKRQFSRKKSSLDDFEDEYDVIIREDEELDSLELAHEENLEEKITILSEYILKILTLNKQMALHEIEELMGSKIDSFLSALFLSHSGKTELIQEEFYKNIWIKRIA